MLDHDLKKIFFGLFIFNYGDITKSLNIGWFFTIDKRDKNYTIKIHSPVILFIYRFYISHLCIAEA